MVRLRYRYLEARHYYWLLQCDSLVVVPLLECDPVFLPRDWLLVDLFADSDCAPHRFQKSLVLRFFSLLRGLLSLTGALAVAEDRVRDLLLLRELELT